MRGGSALNIEEVLENLNTLVDADSLDQIEVTDEDRLIMHKEREQEGSSQREIYWVPAGPDDQTLHAIKNTFKSVHIYLKHSYEKMNEGQDPKRFIEGVGTIMVLVGEATKKMERLGLLFKEKISEMDEYKKLQEFYRNTLIKGVFKNFEHEIKLSEYKKKVEEEGGQEESGVHLLNDIDAVKKDQFYELFYLKNEEGHPYYNLDLARNIKLACDFGEFAQEYFSKDPLLQIKNWEDKNLNLLANHILHQAKNKIRKFYKGAHEFKHMPFVMTLNKALMALMLASNTRNLIRQFAPKGSCNYFRDFQHFLRDALHSRDYQKQQLYPSSEPFLKDAADLVQELCFQLFTADIENNELREGLVALTKLDHIEKDARMSEIIASCYQNLSEAFITHPSGPVFKALDIIREEEKPLFDPLMQGNLPELETVIKENDHEINLLRLACPTMQAIISRAYIVEEFKDYLRAALYKKEGYHHLIVNLQDKTSWKEHARVRALEELAKQAEFVDLFTLVTLNKDSDFYHQSSEYQSISKAADFMTLFKEHLMDEGTGYYFSQKVRNILFEGFIDKLFTQIHKTFFQNHDFFSIEDRQNFIELTYCFIELKLMEETHCSYISLTSKDGLDVSSSASAALVALLRLSENKKLKEKELEHFIYALFGQTLMIRERTLHKDRFDRLLQLIKLLEKHKGYLKPFSSLFHYNHALS